MQHQGRRTILALVAAVALIGGLSWAGRAAREWLTGRGHYTIALTAIECAVPPGVTRGDFLAEVQYLGTLPDELSTLDPALSLRVAAAFALHPWVERVVAVRLRATDGPSAELIFRVPVLAAGGRVLDGNGVLLPAGAPTDGLIYLAGECPPPTGPAGAAWGDTGIEGAARAAAALRPFQVCLKLTEAELTADGLVFGGGVRVLWGRPAGAEAAGEPTTEAKLSRLRDLCSRADGPGTQVDLRTTP